MVARGQESPVCPLAQLWSWGRSALAPQQRPAEGAKPPFAEPWFLHTPPQRGAQSPLAMFSASASPVPQLLEEAWAQKRPRRR